MSPAARAQVVGRLLAWMAGAWSVAAECADPPPAFQLPRNRIAHVRDANRYRVYELSFSPDGSRLATAGEDGTVGIFDVATGACLQTLEAHPLYVWAVAYSPQGDVLATGSEDDTVKLWDANTFKLLATLEGRNDAVKHLAFSPDGTMLAAAGRGAIKLWDVATRQLLRDLKGHTGECYRIAFFSDGKRLASRSPDATVKVWDVATGEERVIARGLSNSEMGLAVSPDGSVIAYSNSADVVLRNLTNGREQVLKGHTSRVWSLAFSPDGRTLTSGSDDHELRQWNVATGQTVAVAPIEDAPENMALSPDGRVLATTAVNTVPLWDAAKLQPLGVVHCGGSVLEALDYSADGAAVALLDNAGRVHVCEPAGPTERTTFDAKSSYCVAISPDHTKVVSGFNYEVLMWDAASGKGLGNVKGHADRLYALQFSADGKLLASGSGDTTTRLWELPRGTLRGVLFGHTGKVNCVAFSADGKRLATGSDDRSVKVWETAGGAEGATYRGHSAQVLGVAFSPDGKWVVSGGHERVVRVWEAANGQEVRLLKLGDQADGANCVAMSPDGRLLAAGDGDGVIHLWSLQTGEVLPALIGQRGNVKALDFSPDSRVLASCAGPRVYFWDVSP